MSNGDGKNQNDQAGPDQPLVLLAVGPQAMETVAALPRAAHDLQVRVRGPFGQIAVSDPAAGHVHISSCRWLSELTKPSPVEPGASSAWQNLQGDGAASQALAGDLIALTRRLRPPALGFGPALGPVPRLHMYVVIDLSAPLAVDAALELAGRLARLEPSMEITGLALTGRTAQSLTSTQNTWLEPFGTLVERLQPQGGSRGSLHRLYLVDGQNTRRTWLQTPAELHRLAADFILHHGLSPHRKSLRQAESALATVNDDFLVVCGSFCCRRLHSGIEVVHRGVAEVLAREGLADFSHDPGTAHHKQIRESAQRLGDRIVEIYRTGQHPLAESAPRDDGRALEQERGKRVRAALRDVLAVVCEKQPVESVRRFLADFRAVMAQMLSSCQLKTRVDARYDAVMALRRQDASTYARMRDCLWAGYVFTQPRRPAPPPEPAPVPVSQPPSFVAYLIGLVLLLVGVGVVVLACLRPDLRCEGWLAAVGGLLALAAAGIIMILPNECRSWQPRRITRGQPTKSVGLVDYRCKEAAWLQWLKALLVAAGLAVAGWMPPLPTDPGPTVQSRFWLGAFWLLLVGLGTFLVLWSARRDVQRTYPDNVTCSLAGEAGPVAWLPRILGLALLGLAWIALCTNAPAGFWPRIRADWGLPVQFDWRWLTGGAALVAIGLAWAGAPRRACGQLYEEILPDPNPPAPAPAPDENVTALQRLLDQQLTPRLQSMMVEERPVQPVDEEWPPPEPAGTILDALVKYWARRLAERLAGLHDWKSVAGDPHAWADCIADALMSADPELPDPARLFALCQVRRWTEGRTVESFLDELPLDPQRFADFVDQVCSPHWPRTRQQSEVDQSIIVVGDELWERIERLVGTNPRHILLHGRWADPRSVVIVRIVQGLRKGWREQGPPPSASPLAARL